MENQLCFRRDNISEVSKNDIKYNTIVFINSIKIWGDNHTGVIETVCLWSAVLKRGFALIKL